MSAFSSDQVNALQASQQQNEGLNSDVDTWGCLALSRHTCDPKALQLDLATCKPVTCAQVILTDQRPRHAVCREL